MFRQRCLWVCYTPTHSIDTPYIIIVIIKQVTIVILQGAHPVNVRKWNVGSWWGSAVLVLSISFQRVPTASHEPAARSEEGTEVQVE